ncbi:MAG: undecaprenyl-diphosphate phosphatase BcrC [Ktedonobacteraceae bacterium]
MFSALLNVNYSIFQEINAAAGAHPWLDSLMVFCANSLIFLFPLVLVMTWGRPLSWRRHSIKQEEELLRERRSVVIWVGIACLVAYGINLLIEQFVFEPRPFVSHHVHLLVTHVADSSFPSDHTAWGFAVVGMLLFQFFPLLPQTYLYRKEALTWRPFLVPYLVLLLAVVLASSIGFARIFVGVHYPGDILGGAIDGLVAAVFVTLLRRRLARPTNAIIQLAHKLRIA